MARGVRLSDEVREAILADLRCTLGAPEGSTRRVAERHGVAQTSVRSIMRDAGLSSPADARAKTENATAATAANNAARRATLAARLLTVAEEALDDMHRPALVYNFGGKDNTYNSETLPRPDFAGRRQLATIAAIAIDKHEKLDRYDNARQGVAELDRFLAALAGPPPADIEAPDDNPDDAGQL